MRVHDLFRLCVEIVFGKERPHQSIAKAVHAAQALFRFESEQMGIELIELRGIGTPEDIAYVSLHRCPIRSRVGEPHADVVAQFGEEGLYLRDDARVGMPIGWICHVSALHYWIYRNANERMLCQFGNSQSADAYCQKTHHEDSVQ